MNWITKTIGWIVLVATVIGAVSIWNDPATALMSNSELGFSVGYMLLVIVCATYTIKYKEGV